MRATIGILPELLRVQLWLVPSVMALVAALAAVAVTWIEANVDWLGAALDLDADSARSILTAISGAMISFTALVFSVTMLVLQLASTQLSPRVARSFLRDRFNQTILGLFVATFVFSLLVLTGVGTDSVPQFGVIGAIILVLAAMMAFVAYLDHMAHAIRPTSVLQSITSETRAAIDAAYPPEDEDEADFAQAELAAGPGPRVPTPGDSVVIWPDGSGYVQAVDADALLGFGSSRGQPVDLQVGVGEFLAPGMKLLRVRDGRGETIEADQVDLEDAVVLGDERTMSEDPAFGFRQVVDVALRALSPSLHDPTTANQAIDRLHELLRRLQARSVATPRVVTGDGGSVVRIPQPDWDAFVCLSVEEIATASRSMPPVAAHLRSILADLDEQARPAQIDVVRRWLAHLGDEETERVCRDEPG